MQECTHRRGLMVHERPTRCACSCPRPNNTESAREGLAWYCPHVKMGVVLYSVVARRRAFGWAQFTQSTEEKDSRFDWDSKCPARVMYFYLHNFIIWWANIHYRVICKGEYQAFHKDARGCNQLQVTTEQDRTLEQWASRVCVCV